MKLQKHDAAHLLRRFAFGATPSEVSRFTELNRQQAITQLFSAGIVEDTGLDLDQVGDISMTEAQDHWLAHLFDSLPNVRDRQLFFWHDHFSIIGRKVRSAELSWQAHNDMRRLAMGDFAPLLSAISFSPAMIVHLDNQTNVAGNPQENFARELLELHTVGVGNFSESDVITMAQAWTGHGLSGSRSAGDLASFFYEARHDSSVNTMFGREASWSAHAALEELTTGVKAMDTARYLVAKVLSYYVGDHVTQDVVNDLAVMFRDSNMNMRELLRIVATLDEFWAPEARYCRVRNPLEYTIGLSRAVGVRPEETRLRGSMSRMGMDSSSLPASTAGAHTPTGSPRRSHGPRNSGCGPFQSQSKRTGSWQGCRRLTQPLNYSNDSACTSHFRERPTLCRNGLQTTSHFSTSPACCRWKRSGSPDTCRRCLSLIHISEPTRPY